MKPINIGICGLGTVGYGSFMVLKSNSREIARRVGYGSASTFSTAFRRHVGQSPGRYARQHTGTAGTVTAG